tara:strand:+ start:616 stop:2514 length:1899 start_codon:yes stop_codon:yes gene_type:complete
MSDSTINPGVLGLRNSVVSTREDSTNNINYYLGFIKFVDGRQQIVYFDQVLNYNPSTGVLTAPSFSGGTSTITITSDISSSTVQYLTFVAGTGSQSLKIALNEGFAYYPSTETLATSSGGSLSIGTVGWTLAAPQSKLLITSQNSTNIFTLNGINMGCDSTNNYPQIALVSTSATGKPHIKFCRNGNNYDGLMEYDLSTSQINFYVNQSANKVLQLKANSVDVEENLNANTGVINLISAGNTNLNFYESATHRWSWGYNTSSNYIFLQDVVNSRDPIQCLDNSHVKINPYAVGDVQIGMNPSSNPSLEIKSTIIETNVDLDVQGDCSVRENFLVGTVGAYTLGHPSTLLKFHTGTSGYGVNEASVFMGTGDVAADTYAFGMYFGSNTGTGSSFIQTGIRTFSTGVNISNYNLLLQPHWGNVGINTTDPRRSLDVRGTWPQITATTSSGNTAIMGEYSGTPLFGAHNFALNAWAFAQFYGGFAPTPSDARVKQNIRNADIDHLYNEFGKLRVACYDYKEGFTGRDFGCMQGSQVGFIAQEVDQIFPNVITKKDMNWGTGELADFHCIDKMRLSDYANAALLKAMEKIQTLEEENTKLKNEIELIKQDFNQKLEEENTKLKNEIEIIKQHLNLT